MDDGAEGVVVADLLLDDVADRCVLLLKVADLPPGVVQLPVKPRFERAEFGEALGGRKIGHVFESMGGAVEEHPGGLPDRFRVTLAAAGREVMNGWWASEETARSKFRDWIGEHGSRPGARITLVDEETDTTLTTWPDEA